MVNIESPSDHFKVLGFQQCFSHCKIIGLWWGTICWCLTEARQAPQSSQSLLDVGLTRNCCPSFILITSDESWLVNCWRSAVLNVLCEHGLVASQSKAKFLEFLFYILHVVCLTLLVDMYFGLITISVHLQKSIQLAELSRKMYWTFFFIFGLV